MPLEKVTTRQALDNIRGNKSARTGYRTEGSTWPIFQPDINPGFTINKGTKIFTIGSCFARNIERSLRSAGFDVPSFGVVDGLNDRHGKLLENEPQIGIFNKYTPPSMYNDARWQTEDLDPLSVLYKTGDLYWNSQIHLKTPLPEESSHEIAKKIFEYNKSAYTADVIIMTLGLVEAWYDTKRGLYLNEKPPGKLSLDERFQCHTLSYPECKASILNYIQSIRAINKSVKFIITVSPVTLATTMSKNDVRVRNMYSKSVLRAVAEEASVKLDNVDYFPSFEMASLSHREEAYAGDDIHIRQSFVDYIIFTFLLNYLESKDLNCYGLAELAFSHALTVKDPSSAEFYHETFRERILGENNIESLILLYKYAELCSDKKTEKQAHIRLADLLGHEGASRVFGGW